MFTVVADLLKAFCKLFTILCFERSLKEHYVAKILRAISAISMKIIVTLIPINLVTNWLLSHFLSFVRSKNKDKFFKKFGRNFLSRLVTKNISVFIYSESCSTSRHSEFNRLL